MEQAQILDACYGGTAAMAASPPGTQDPGFREQHGAQLLPQSIKPLTTVLANKIPHFSLGLVPYLNLCVQRQNSLQNSRLK